ncbi:MAG: AbrB/MazE/SpoVT family DNA-binding domain-containing protein [Betaproteobacteria bacterium]|nr:AbrB/MazE/SpoVT family DNA-binding domain-containing protein [Betaproteobacteria bacterium]MBI2960835.1 AbrB/MazE/SpoVT family DNA-binding domain-containing protein [Betaproteobacteria bacterium]
MLAKLTSKNQLTLPKAVISQFPGAQYFEVKAEKGRIVLVPAKVSSMDAVWDKIESLGVTQKDVESAVRWARRRRK